MPTMKDNVNKNKLKTFNEAHDKNDHAWYIKLNRSQYMSSVLLCTSRIHKIICALFENVSMFLCLML